MHELRRYGQRVWLKSEHVRALVLPKDIRSGSINSYCFGGCVLLTAHEINYRTLLSSIDGIKKAIQAEHVLKLEEDKENEQRRLE